MTEFILSKSKWRTICTISVLTFICNISLALIFNYISTTLGTNFTDGPKKMFDSQTEEFIFVVLVAPIFETIGCQFLPLYLLRKRNPYWGASVSIFLFGFLHSYNTLYTVYGLLVGVLFVLSYRMAERRGANPIATVTLAHLIYNFIAFMLNNLL